MAYRADYNAEWDCVHLILSGPVDIHECYASRYKVRDLLSATKCRKLLVDTIQADLVLSDEEQEQFFNSHQNLLPLGLRIGVVVNEHWMAMKDSIEAPTMAPGVTQRLFRTELEALNWLL